MFDLEKLPKQAGNYVIVGLAVDRFSLDMKKFGLREMPAGYYLYCGSAHGPGGLKSRVSRHLDLYTKKFWHFDYLKEYLDSTCVWWQVSSANFECETAQFLFSLPGASCVVPGFGASDCRKGCLSHLVYFPNLDYVEQAWRKLNRKTWDYRQLSLKRDEIG